MRMRVSLLILASLTLAAQDGREVALGAWMAKSIHQCATSLGNEDVQEYVAQLARRLSSGAASQFTVEVAVDGLGESTNPANEPLSLPGGYIFVSTNLILAAQNEAELAGMLAHAMARQAVLHAGPGNPPIAWTDMNGWCGSGMLPVAIRDRQRANRLQADQVAVRMLTAAGYDPHALIDYLTREQADAERIAALEQVAESASPSGSLFRDDRFLRIQQEVRNLLPNPIRRPPSLRRATR